MSARRIILTVVVALGVSSAVPPAFAGAFATVAPPPNFSTNSGLPDGRVYEQVSPANKHGYEAGAGVNENEFGLVKYDVSPGVAAADGNAFAYGARGAVAEIVSSGMNNTFVAQRTPQGWRSRSATARGRGLNEQVSILLQEMNWLDFSPDLSHLAYDLQGSDVKGAPFPSKLNLYLSGPDTLEEPVWLARPTAQISGGTNQLSIVGMAPDAKTVYFMYEGPLTPGDAPSPVWHLYEYKDGTLREAGVLPDGSVPSGGATPVAMTVSPGTYQRENSPASLDNEVSEDGRRVFFAGRRSQGNSLELGLYDLYVHEIETDGTEKSVLVSASQVPGHVGEAAPDGVSDFANPATSASITDQRSLSVPTVGFASPDGSHVFFESTDQLTGEAPTDSSPKTYVFDVDTSSLEYLPGVSLAAGNKLGGIVTAARNGSFFVFVNGTAAIPELDMWRSGPHGGTVSPIVQLPEPGGGVGPGYFGGDGSTFVFQTGAPIAGFNNGDGQEQVYRYDVKTDEVSCLSCPPAGIHPSGSAYMSVDDAFFNKLNATDSTRVINSGRGISGDGTRVFFDSQDPLVARDTNGRRDVYEWENGSVFLVSSGTSSLDSFLFDNGESGADVFFATTDELVQGDNDGAFDIYDARIPHPGDNPPPSAVPCQGDVCQGPPSTPELFGAPASATFNGLGNVASEPALASAKSKSRRVSHAQQLAIALRACRRLKSGSKRSVCERQARGRYKATGATVKHNGRGGK
jgi:hypothetical protein